MELGSHNDMSTEISDAQRMAASTRQVTIDPMHDDVAPDDLPDEQIATRHILQPAIGNIPTDSEHTLAPAAHAAKAVKTHRFALAVSLAVVGVLTTVSVLAFLNY